MAPRRRSAAAQPRAVPDAERLAALKRRLAKAIPAPRCELDFGSPWQLLIATMLSAQSTDRTVNRVTPELFRSYPTPAALAEAPPADVEAAVKSTGFFRNKARAIQAASRVLVEEHGGEVPADLESLVRLPGVARKTANVVLGTALGVAAGIVVDTHVGRVARRLELTDEQDPAKVERDLCAAFTRRTWVDAGHRLLLHGRYVCLARSPRCGACPLNELCPAREADPEGSWSARAAAEAAALAARDDPDA